MGIGSALVIEPDSDRRAALVSLLATELAFDAVAGLADLSPLMHDEAVHGPPSLLIINIDTPEMQKMGSWAMLRARLGPGLRILALTEGQVRPTLEIALGAGVSGLHDPDTDLNTLRRSIIRILRGEVVFDPALADRAKHVLMGPHDEEMQIRVGGLSIDLESRAVSRWGKAIDLSPLEYKVLVHLARHQGRAISPAELLEAAWGTSVEKGGTYDQVKGCIKRLRRKIEPVPQDPRYLRSLRGRGYVLHDFLADRPETLPPETPLGN